MSLSKSKSNTNAHSSLVTDHAESEVSPSFEKSAVEKDANQKLIQSSIQDSATSDEADFVHDAVLLPETVAAVLGVKSLPKQTEVQ